MKRIFTVIIFSLVILLPAARAEGPDDQYVSIYNIIQQGDTFNEKGQAASAMAKYAEAETELKRFHANYPDWNIKVVNYRLKYLAAKITELSSQPPPPAVTNTPAAPATNAPAEISTNAPPAPAPATPAPAPSNNTPPAPATPAPEPPKAAAPVPTAPNFENEIKNLQEQIRNIEADKALLQAKLKEALSAQPAAVDPQELAKAQAQIKDLQKQNELLQVTLDQARTNVPATGPAEVEKAKRSLAEANRKVSQLTEENATLSLEKDALLERVKKSVAPDANSVALLDENTILKKQLAELQARQAPASPADELSRQLKESQAQIAALQSEKEILRLQKITLEDQFKKMAAAPTPAPAPAVASTSPEREPVLDSVTADKIAQLVAQRDALQKTVNAVTKDLYGRKKGKAMADRIDEMSREMGTLRARLEMVEASPVPYTAEELAFLSQPSTTLMASVRNSARKSVRELPASAAVTLDEAKRYFVAHELDKAEAKYLEVLKLDQKNVVVLADLAAIELELGRAEDAEKNIKAALAVEPNDDYSLFVLGQVKFREKNYDEAFTALSRAAEINPQNAKVQNFLGLTLSEKGMRGPAETAFRKAIQYDPGFAQAHVNLAVVYITQQPPLVELAKWHYQKALAAGQPPNPGLEKLLDPTKTADAGH